ncbi:MAG: formimidoylglutamate deiminase [Actinobacteria bacterium]|nr:formimidoylglutamate deiminase [Actinomycetota bacterium]
MSWWCELAWLGGGAEQATAGVVIEASDGRITSVHAGVAAPPAGATRLDGLTIPGLANAHSHAFHRALRGRTRAGTGSFWTWRDQMYGIAQRLDPDAYFRLARATYAEMALAGITVVGEFHYVHHQPDGTPYADANAMGEALLAAAAEAGIRITLLDTCYLHGGLTADGYAPLADHQRRFGDRHADAWAARAAARCGAGSPTPMAVLGAAVHSVRAVDPASMAAVGAWATGRDAPLHIHLSEQPAENEACLAHHGRTPTELLHDAGLLGERLTAVHATHLTDADLGLLASTRSGVCLCPTTERDLADGIGPTGALAAAGVPLCLGSDSHAVIDPFEEARAVELDERLATLVRGTHPASALLTAATATGYSALGWDGGGVLAEGSPVDLTTVGLDSVRLAGTDADSALASVVFAATAADVTYVVVGGNVVVSDGAHASIDVAAELDASIRAVTGSAA